MSFGGQQGQGQRPGGYGQGGPGGYGQGGPGGPGGPGGFAHGGPGGFAQGGPPGGPGGFAARPPPGGGYGQQGPPQGQQRPQQGPPQGQQRPPQGQQYGGGYGPGPSAAGGQGRSQGHGQGQQGVKWVSATDGFIPPEAVQGGTEKDGRPLFVARTMYKGGLHPGKAGQHIEGGCCIGWGHKEINTKEYQVLCGNASQLRWVKQEGALQIQSFVPVEAGHEETGEPLYVAKALYEGSQQLGKCAPHIKKGMAFPYGHKERTTDNYMVLAYAT
ncbi:hypothetical protein H4R19_004433 [Coemansia spiralis]|nr:hypothetical protein H4R19_004433 [Coemansia spiralis]